jgi:uncharacterized membrane protein
MSYTYQIVSAPGHTYNTALTSINDMGEVGGYLTAQYPTQSFQEAFTLSGSTYTPLGSGPYGTTYSFGNALNNHGDLAGQSGIYGFVRTSAGTYSEMTMGGNPSTVAYGLNDNGVVVGAVSVPGTMPGSRVTGTFAAEWTNGHGTGINMPAGVTWSVAHGINDQGTVVGTYGTTAGYPGHAFVDKNGHVQEIKIPGAVSAEADGISNTGEIVGTYQTADGHYHGFFDLAGHIHTLNIPGNIDTFLYGVNDFGQMVGSATSAPGHEMQGFVVTPSDMPTRLSGNVMHETGITAGGALAYTDPNVQHLALALTS